VLALRGVVSVGVAVGSRAPARADRVRAAFAGSRFAVVLDRFAVVVDRFAVVVDLRRPVARDCVAGGSVVAIGITSFVGALPRTASNGVHPSGAPVLTRPHP
jgi:hypothetical protein